MIQGAVNSTRKEQDLPLITQDGKMGPETLSAYRELAKEAESRRRLLEKLGERRKKDSRETEKPRIDFFLLPGGK